MVAQHIASLSGPPLRADLLGIFPTLCFVKTSPPPPPFPAQYSYMWLTSVQLLPCECNICVYSLVGPALQPISQLSSNTHTAANTHHHRIVPCLSLFSHFLHYTECTQAGYSRCWHNMGKEYTDTHTHTYIRMCASTCTNKTQMYTCTTHQSAHT